MTLLRATKGLDGAIVQLVSNQMLLGRNNDRCDLVLEHYAVSRVHARIEFDHGRHYLEDMNSRNGVSVNGRRMRPGPDGRVPINTGDVIEIAAFEFIVEDHPSSDSVVVNSDETVRPEVVSTIDVSEGSNPDVSSGGGSAKLNLLLTVIEQVSRERVVNEVLPQVLDSLFTAFPQTQSAFIVLRDEDGSFQPAAERRDSDGPIHVSQAIVEQITNKQQAVLFNCPDGDDKLELSPSVTNLELQSVMCAPLLDRDKGESTGFIQIEVSKGRPFIPADLEVLAAIGRHVSLTLENARLHATALDEQRQQYEQQFTRLVEGSIQGIAIHREFHPLFVNRAWADLHGYAVDESLGLSSLLDLVIEADRARAEELAAAVMAKASGPTRYETQHVRKDGEAIWVELFLSPVDWDGQPAVQVAAIDITTRKEAETSLVSARDDLEARVVERTRELARSNQDLEQFAHSVSHDLQAPLRTIANYCQLLEREQAESLDDAGRSYISASIDAASRMKRLLDDLLQYSRVHSKDDQFVPVDCNRVLDAVRLNLAAQIEEHSAEVAGEFLPTVVGDEAQLMQLLQNLIANALVYSGDQPPRVSVRAEELADAWRIEVADNGIGIAPAHHERIFQMFQRLFTEDECPGSGVGLAVCKRIVERHGGEISIESTPGQGSTFAFTLAKQPPRHELP